MDALTKAVKAIGSGAKLSRHFGITRAAVCKWAHTRIPAERVLEIERISGVSRHELRPDLYPVEPAEAVEA